MVSGCTCYTVNLHLLMVSFTDLRKRYKIILRKHFLQINTPLNRRFVFTGLDPDDAIIEVKPKRGEHYLHTSDIQMQ